MSSELIAVIVGGAIGTIGSLATTIVLKVADRLQSTKSIQAITAAEVTAIKEKAQRYIEGMSTAEELSASTPMLTSIASTLGYLSPKQIITFRRAVTLDMEMRKASSKEKALSAVEACEEALRALSVKA